MANHLILKPFILRWEGGFVNDPHDNGGATNKGITIATWRLHGRDIDLDGDIDVDDLRLITDADWTKIYKQFYWDKCMGDKIIDQAKANMIVDWCWMSGSGAIKKVQQLVGVKQDGAFGPITLAAVNNYATFCKDIYEMRVKYYNAICAKNPTQRRFLNGWINRLNKMMEFNSNGYKL